MAKVGEGDPRWLVKEREDGRNVNNWHWTEADLTPWAKEALTERLGSLVLVDDAEAKVEVTAAKGFAGDVTVSTRKGRTIFFYDLAIELEWRGELKDGSLADAKGTAKLADIEQDSDEFECRVAVQGAESAGHRTLKEKVRAAGRDAIAKVIDLFNADLRERASAAMAGKASPAEKKKTVDVEKLAESTANGAALPSTTTEVTETVSTASGGQLKTTKFSKTLKFRCRPQDLIECFTDPARVRAFTQDSNAKIGRASGEEFSHYDGMLSGSVVTLDASQMVWQWRLRSWPAGHHAQIAMALEFGDGETTMRFEATRVPAGQKDDTERAFEHFYWQRIKNVFGFL